MASTAAATAPITLKDLAFDQASKLSTTEQLELAMSILKGLKKAIGGKKKSTSSSDSDEPKPKKALTPAMAAWHAGLKAVRETIQEADDPKFSLKNAMTVCKALRAEGNWPEPSRETILESYTSFKESGAFSSSSASSVASSQPSKVSKASKAEPKPAKEEAKPEPKAKESKHVALAASPAGGSTLLDETEKRLERIAKMKASLATKRAAAASGDPISAMSGEELRNQYETLTGKKKPSAKFTTRPTLIDEIKRLMAMKEAEDEMSYTNLEEVD